MIQKNYSHNIDMKYNVNGGKIKLCKVESIGRSLTPNGTKEGIRKGG